MKIDDIMLNGRVRLHADLRAAGFTHGTVVGSAATAEGREVLVKLPGGAVLHVKPEHLERA